MNNRKSFPNQNNNTLLINRLKETIQYKNYPKQEIINNGQLPVLDKHVSVRLSDNVNTAQ